MKDSQIELGSVQDRIDSNRDERMKIIQSKEQQHSQLEQATSSVIALLYKSYIIQKRNYCSNICQLITPLVCIAFTLLAQLISNEIISNKIQSLNFPQPLDFPYYYSLVDRLGLSCEQSFMYQTEGEEGDNKNVEMLLNKTLKYYCDKTDSLMPQYTHAQNVNQQLMKRIKQADVQAFQRGNDLKTNLPDGFVKFKSVNNSTLNATYGINDLRLPQYHKNNGLTKIIIRTGENQHISSYLRVTQGMMSLMQRVHRAFLQLTHPKEIILGSIMYMPFDGEDKSLKNKIINILGAGLYPLGLSLLLPIFLYAIVSQKQQRLVEIMKMNGLNVKYYWVSSFIFNFSIIVLMMIIFYSFGRYYLQLTMFVQTDVMVFWILLIGWAISLVAMTNFVQIFINSAKSATIIGYLLSIFSCFVGEAITTFIYAYPQAVPLPILFYPPFALCRAIYLIGFNCASNSSCYKDIFHTDQQFLTIIYILYGWFLIYLLSIWLNDMIQQQYGVSQYPDIIKKCLKCLKKKQQKIQLVTQQSYGEKEEIIENVQIEMNQSTKFIIQDSASKTQLDQSIMKLNEQVDKMHIEEKPMVIKGLSKKYEILSSENKDYIALKPLSLYMQEKQIFGLLGPNGAGKTTMISVLTGMYPQSSGNAYINGMSIGTPSTNRYIGVCPQFDLLWPDMTVYEHLKFYSLLKMVKSQILEQEITQLLKDVDLLEWKDTASNKLSGGMQRRLSLAISLVGNPKVVFLDEPSSGLDPSHRRQMWNILLKCKKRTSILLTTHLMQQAQVLCDRVGILCKGQLRCIGTINELKDKFGKGYRLTISYSNQLKNHLKRKSSVKSQKDISLVPMNMLQNDQLKSSSYQLQEVGSSSLRNDENQLQDKQKQQQQSINSKQQNEQQDRLRPKLVDNIIQMFNGEIVNQLNTRVVLKIDKSKILQCIELLKQQPQLNWLVSQPSLYDVFVYFVK